MYVVRKSTDGANKVSLTAEPKDFVLSMDQKEFEVLIRAALVDEYGQRSNFKDVVRRASNALQVRAKAALAVFSEQLTVELPT